MTDSLKQLVCPNCGHKGLFINTKGWKPTRIKCTRLSCGWHIDLEPLWQGGKA